MIYIFSILLIIVFFGAMWLSYKESQSPLNPEIHAVEPISNNLSDYIKWFKEHGSTGRDFFRIRDTREDPEEIAEYLDGLVLEKPQLRQQIETWFKRHNIEMIN